MKYFVIFLLIPVGIITILPVYAQCVYDSDTSNESCNDPEFLVEKYAQIAEVNTDAQDKMKQLQTELNNEMKKQYPDQNTIQNIQTAISEQEQILLETGQDLSEIQKLLTQKIQMNPALKQTLETARDILHQSQDIIPWTGLGVSSTEQAVSISIDAENPEEYRSVIEKLIGKDIPVVIKKGGNPFLSQKPFPPLKQFNSGIPVDEIQCRESLTLVTKNNGSPACVKEQTLLKLVERGLIITSIVERDLMLDAGYKLYPGVGWVKGIPEKSPSPEPKPIPEEERLLKEEQDQAKIQTQKEIMTDYRGNQHQIDAINKYREEFDSGYFLEQFVIPNKQNFEKDELINFVVVQWGYQPEKCISYDVKGYFKPYENYDPFYAEKISEWKDTQECTSVIASDSNGYVVVNMNPIPGIPEEHLICNNPGEYRILVRNLDDESQVEWGYYTCQRDKIVGEPQPWMNIPE